MTSNRIWIIVLVMVSAALLLFGCGKKPETPAHGGTGADTVASLADGTTISYDVKGGGYPALVFVHGWMCDGTYWDSQVEHFSKLVKCVTVDLAGHGKSGMREDVSIESYAADVVSVINKLKLERVILVGHSMGGPIITEAAKQLEEVCFGLIGVDSFHNMKEDWTEEQFLEWLKAFEEDFAGATQDFVRSMFPENADSALVAEVVADMSSGPAATGLGAFRAMKNYTLRDHVGDLKQPIITINADLWETDPEGNRELVGSSFEVIMMPGYGHFIMLEDAQLFNKNLADAIQNLVAKSRERG
ncbi:alpha/beta hydrolase [bacterium]|nr:alpha/beta hydrolase [bacterium]MBU1650860.1 alpha/beta hydrolase [bacterium]MBU1882261.1 alpha/beta hydrolase [bacterium]